MSEESNPKHQKKKGTFREYFEALLIAVIAALFIRSFGLEAFKIPSGSMIPTLSIGDHIFVNKFIYGLRIPLTRHRFFRFTEPKRGDVVVFIYPEDESKDFIKRVIGLPGDRIRIFGESVSVNGETLPRHRLTVKEYPSDKRKLLVKNSTERAIPFVRGWRDFDFYDELAGDTDHLVQYEKYLDRDSYDLVVPPGYYFVMGDNRDNSADSREWGFVPDGNIKGKAMFVWLSIDKDHGGIRWREFGRWIK